MKRPSMGRRLAALTATATLVLAGAAAAAADNLEAVDELGASVGTLTLNACVGEPASAAVSLVIDRRGGGPDGLGATVYANSAVVSVVGASSLPAVSVSIPAPATIALPSNWTTLASDSRSSSVTATVMLAAQQAPASGTATVTFTATGARSVSSPSSPLQRNDTVAVNWTVTDCAPPNTPPVLTVPDNITAEATGPTGAVVEYVATADDDQDGALIPSCDPASASTFPFGETTVTCSVTDSGGLSDTDTFTVTVEDTTPPDITVPANMTVDPTGAFGAVVTYSASASDLVDGDVPPTCVPASGTLFVFGTTTVTCSATDAAENAASASFTVTVNNLTRSGFYRPVDMTITNTVKGGSTVPLKFELVAGGNELTDTAVVKSFKATAVPCGSLPDEKDEVDIVTTGKTSLRYDTTEGQFIQNWQTPKTPGACYVVTMTTQDNQKMTANFQLK
jgi:hypothetical protein